LKSATALLRDIQFKDAIEKRKRTRSKRLGLGDAPTKFQFSHTKARRRQERMKELLLETGETIRDEHEILEQVCQYYQKLYAEEEVDSVEQQRATEELLS
jgi:hypothetical protein